MILSQRVVKDLKLFKFALQHMNGVSIYHIVSEPTHCVELYTDACLTGIGAYCEGDWIYMPLPPYMQSMNIAILEGFALVTAFKSFEPHLYGKNVRIYVDNMVLYCCVKLKWAQNNVMMALIYTLAMLAIEFKCRFWVRWINTKLNWMADMLSRGMIDDLFVRMHLEDIPINMKPTDIIIPDIDY